MSRKAHRNVSVLALLYWLCQVSVVQCETPPAGINRESNAIRPASLPTDRSLRVEDRLPLNDPFRRDTQSLELRQPSELSESPTDFSKRIRPRFDTSAEWEPRVDGVAISSYDMSIRQPLYPVFGPPPPLINAGYSLTRLDAPAVLDLPENLHEFSLGLAWMRPINDKFMARLMLNGVFASDLDNTGSDAWQIRGGAFLLYRHNEQWDFAFGALVTGRADIPVIPGVGAIWKPSQRLIVNLMMPTPRVSLLLAEQGGRQHWGYIGGGLSGGTWAYNRASGLGNRLSYREWRIVLGWESTPTPEQGTFTPPGTTLNAEIGFVFGRNFEFDSNRADIALDETLLLRVGVRF